MIKGLKELLDAHPIFGGMDKQVRETIAECGEKIEIPEGKYFIREGDLADRFYLLRRGRAALEIHVAQLAPVVIATRGENDVLGWSWMTPPYLWHFDVRAMVGVEAISINAACLKEMWDTEPELGLSFYKNFTPIIASRLEATRMQLIDMYGRPRSQATTWGLESGPPAKPTPPGAKVT